MDLDLGFEPRRRAALLEAKSRRSPTVTRPIKLVQGGRGFLVYVPSYAEEEFRGFVLAVFRIESWLSDVMGPVDSQFGAIRVFDGTELLYAQFESGESGAAQKYAGAAGVATVDLLDTKWQLHVEPSAQFIAQRLTPWPWVVLGVGLVLSALLGLIAWLALQQRQRNRDMGVLQIELSTREARTRGVLDNLDIGVALWDADGRLSAWNAPFESYHGDFVDVLKRGLVWQDMVRTVAQKRASEGHAADADAYVARRLEERESPGQPLLRKLDDGSVFVIRDLPMPDGGMIETFTDITTEQRQREDLTAREILLASILANLSHGVAFFDADGYLQRWNEAFLAHYPHLRELVEHKPSLENLVRANVRARDPGVSPGDENERVAARIAEHQASGVALESRTPAGRTILVRKAFADDGGQIITTADVTILKQREQELQRSNRDLEQFAYLASHDLQEPLRMVASYTQLLGRRYGDVLDADGQKFVALAMDGANHMKSLVSDLLEYSRVGRDDAAKQAVALNQVLDLALSSLRLLVAESGVQLFVEPMPSVHGRSKQLVQLFQNLIENAIKFRGDEALLINVSAVRRGPEIEVSVADNGIGVDPRHFERIFEPFKRLHRRDQIAGNGIGLSLCGRIVMEHGGRIGVSSELGKGATFTFTLMASDAGGESGHPELGAPTDADADLICSRAS